MTVVTHATHEQVNFAVRLNFRFVLATFFVDVGCITIQQVDIFAWNINVIKEVRAITNLGLKEAKDLVDAAEKEAKVVKEGMPKADAEKAKKLLEDAGATVELR